LALALVLVILDFLTHYNISDIIKITKIWLNFYFNFNKFLIMLEELKMLFLKYLLFTINYLIFINYFITRHYFL